MNEPRTIEEQYTMEKLFGGDWQASHREVRAEYERLQAMKFIRDNDQPTPKP